MAKEWKVIKELLEAGPTSVKELMEKAGLKNRRELNKQLRLLEEFFDMYIFEEKDKTITLLTGEEAEARKEMETKIALARKEHADQIKALDKLLKSKPQAKGERLFHKASTKLDALIAANQKFDADLENDLLNLKAQKASIEFKIAEYESEMFVSTVLAVMPDLTSDLVADHLAMNTLDSTIKAKLEEITNG